MGKKQKELFNNLTIFVGSVIFAFVAILFSGPISFQTMDDTQLLYKGVFDEKTQVKGAFSKNDFCPEIKPVIGWIDFQGNKKIVESLPADQQPSACFETLDKAKEEGYTL
jgi:hypothetical protein